MRVNDWHETGIAAPGLQPSPPRTQRVPWVGAPSLPDLTADTPAASRVAGARGEASGILVGMKLTGKTAIVTGGSAGIGLAIARRLGSEGSRVAICGRSRERLEKASEELTGQGITSFSDSCDVQDPEAVRTFVTRVVERFGTVDILVNNAGANEPTPLQDPDDGAWQRDIRTCLDGAYYCTTRVLQ